tara:strand:+ start:15270 stop:16148 length:879 start_codon:yes stop_codon:yes gene_type:complete
MYRVSILYLTLIIELLYSTELEPTFLVLNHFDQSLPNAEKALLDNFNNSSFEFDSTISLIYKDLDTHDNPASIHMNKIKDLGEKFEVNYILLNHIEHLGDRFILDGLLFNTRSGGLIQRRKIDLKQYLDGQVNELNMWVGNALGKVEKNWQSNRQSLLFQDSENIEYEKTPRGAAIRSLVFPGWGQAYSGKKISAGLWASAESSLSLATIICLLNYEEAVKSFQNNKALYHEADDENQVSEYRASAESDWDDHKKYSQLTIALATLTGAGWITNGIYAWATGPRAQTNIYQK